MSFMRYPMSGRHGRNAKGAALVVGLIFLVLLMLMGVAAFNAATVEERQAGNMRDRVRALEGAEYALRICEADLQGAVVPTFTQNGLGSAGKTGYYISPPGASDLYVGFDWSTKPTRKVDDPYFNRDLKCIFERLDGAPVRPSGQSVRAELPQYQGSVYRVTARGTGVSPGTVSIVQSYYTRD